MKDAKLLKGTSKTKGESGKITMHVWDWSAQIPSKQCKHAHTSQSTEVKHLRILMDAYTTFQRVHLHCYNLIVPSAKSSSAARLRSLPT
eukprot:m.24474 g.24474  ORF g.24474 m.24474 type:complete len:89 (+) comp8594_c0_seq4:1041-1307(+)